MKLKNVHIKNFRRLEDVQIDLDDGETVFVGPNNSGKTSATSIFRYFLKGTEFRIHDFSVSKIREIDHFRIYHHLTLAFYRTQFNETKSL